MRVGLISEDRWPRLEYRCPAYYSVALIWKSDCSPSDCQPLWLATCISWGAAIYIHSIMHLNYKWLVNHKIEKRHSNDHFLFSYPSVSTFNSSIPWEYLKYFLYSKLHHYYTFKRQQQQQKKKLSFLPLLTITTNRIFSFVQRKDTCKQTSFFMKWLQTFYLHSHDKSWIKIYNLQTCLRNKRKVVSCSFFSNFVVDFRWNMN